MINQKIYKELVRGLEQELWFLGIDTYNRKCNLLQRYGFTRYKTPGQRGSSRYELKLGTRTLDLHSFCVGMYGGNKNGFLYVRAHDLAYTYFGPKAPMPGRYRKSFLERPIAKKSKELFFEVSCEFLEWVEQYESWIDATCGKGYRIACYKRYHRKWLSPAKARKWFAAYGNLGEKNHI